MYVSRISKEDVNRFPITAFEGEIHLIEDADSAIQAITELSKEKIVGLDTETKPSFTRQDQHKVALLQIATLNTCYLFRLNKMSFPPQLAIFLANKSIKKVGLALRDDLIGLNKHYRFKGENIVDIQSIASRYGILELSLQKIFAIVFAKKISKAQRLTNWENTTLTNFQQIYAATDAWACLLVYHQLMKENELPQKIILEIKKEDLRNQQIIHNQLPKKQIG